MTLTNTYSYCAFSAFKFFYAFVHFSIDLELCIAQRFTMNTDLDSYVRHCKKKLFMEEDL